MERRGGGEGKERRWETRKGEHRMKETIVSTLIEGSVWDGTVNTKGVRGDTKRRQVSAFINFSSHSPNRNQCHSLALVSL